MAPSTKKLRAALIDATCQIFQAEPDATTVNKVRKQAEADLSLDDGFFASAEWKQSSKQIIKDHVVSRRTNRAQFTSFAQKHSHDDVRRNFFPKASIP